MDELEDWAADWDSEDDDDDDALDNLDEGVGVKAATVAAGSKVVAVGAGSSSACEYTKASFESWL